MHRVGLAPGPWQAAGDTACAWVYSHPSTALRRLRDVLAYTKAASFHMWFDLSRQCAPFNNCVYFTAALHFDKIWLLHSLLKTWKSTKRELCSVVCTQATAENLARCPTCRSLPNLAPMSAYQVSFVLVTRSAYQVMSGSVTKSGCHISSEFTTTKFACHFA